MQSRVASGGELRARRFQEALPATPSSHEEPGPAAHWSRQAPFKGLQTLPGLSGPRPWPHQPWGLATCSIFSSRWSAWLPGSLLQPLSTVPPVAPPLRARPPAVGPATQGRQRALGSGEGAPAWDLLIMWDSGMDDALGKLAIMSCAHGHHC